MTRPPLQDLPRSTGTTGTRTVDIGLWVCRDWNLVPIAPACLSHSPTNR
jgi:hypothetical protein